MTESESSAMAIECRGLTKRYKGHLAIENLDWQVSQGTVTALLGKNGAGKTTTLRMLVNLIAPTRGDASVLGKSTKRLAAADFTKIGYVAESQSMPEWMTVGYLMKYLKPMYPTWDEEFCEKLLTLFELPRDRKISELSRGMRMKAAFVSSLAYRPELLLLDEPFSGLDSIVREDLIDALLDLTEQERWTIVISSHDIDDIERLIDHVAIINHGRLLMHVPIETIQERFREISFRSSAKPSVLPDNWLAYKAQGDRVSFIHTEFDEATSVSQLQEQFPDLQDLAMDGMSLKAAYVAMLRARKDQEQPNQRLAS